SRRLRAYCRRRGSHCQLPEGVAVLKDGHQRVAPRPGMVKLPTPATKPKTGEAGSISDTDMRHPDPETVMRLQSTIGNQAVAQLLVQRKKEGEEKAKPGGDESDPVKSVTTTHDRRIALVDNGEMWADIRIEQHDGLDECAREAGEGQKSIL